MGTLYEIDGTLGSITKKLDVGSNIITVTMTGDVDDWNPTGLADANIIFADPNGADRNITGITAPAAGVNKILTIINLSATKKLKIFNNETGVGAGSSDDANCILCRDAGDKDIKKQDGFAIIYDHTVSRWRQYGGRMG